jgi:DoxX-like family
MFIAYIVVGIVTALLLVFSGIGKLRRDANQVQTIHKLVGVPLQFFPWLATAEFAGALGLLVGIAWGPLGIAAAIGVISYFVGATVGHVRVGDAKGVAKGPLLPLILAIVLLVLRILSFAQEPFHF